MHPHPMRRLQRIPKFAERDIEVLAHQSDQRIDEPVQLSATKVPATRLGINDASYGRVKS